MVKGMSGEWLNEYVVERVSQRSTAEKPNVAASIMLLELLRVSGVRGAVQLMKEPGALTVNGQQIVPERFLPARLGKSKLDLKVEQNDWRSPVDANFAVNWADNQDLRVEVARGGITQADVVSRLKALEKRSFDNRSEAHDSSNVTPQTTEPASAEEVAQALNLDVNTIRLTSIHEGGRTPGSFRMGPFTVHPVEAITNNVATRDINSGQWQRTIDPEREPEIVDDSRTATEFVPRNWLVGMSSEMIAYRRKQMVDWRGENFWENYGYRTFEQYYDAYDPLLMSLDARLMPQIGGVFETVNMFNRSMLLSVRAVVTAMTDANVAKHIADLVAGRNGDLAWLVDSRRIDSMIAKFGVVDSALRNAQSSVDSMLEYCLVAVDSSEGSLVVLPADVLATMGAALRSIFTGLEVGRLETAVSFVAAGASPDQISNALKVDARLLRNRK